MARLLGIDWDHDRFYLVSASTGRGTIHVERALTWGETNTQNPGEIPEVAKRLREQMKAASLAPAPVLVSVGRERVIVKEIRYPAVDDTQEPALVRFQATKELTEAPARVVIDYTRLPENGSNERRAMVVAARNDRLGSIHALCRAAGLKLLGIAPRPIGIAACLNQLNDKSGLSAPPPQKDEVVAVLTVSQKWAEFIIACNARVLLARPLHLGKEFLGEVRRNLALFSNQLQPTSPRRSVQALYFAGDNEHALLEEQLRESLAIPVHVLDPFSREVQVEISGDRGGFAGVIGLAQLWTEEKALPINFVHPKEPKVEQKSRAMPYLLAVGGSLVLLLAMFVISTVLLDDKKKLVTEKQEQLTKLNKQIKTVKGELEQKLDKIEQWEQTDLPWIDELYDLTARFPWEQGLKVTQWSASPLPSGGPYSAQMRIKGIVTRNLLNKRPTILKDLERIIDSDPHCRASLGDVKQLKESGSSREVGQSFEIKIDLEKRAVEQYTTKLEIVAPKPRFDGKGRNW